MGKYSYKILLDVNMDAWNWYAACNRTGFGVDWKQRIDSEIADKIVGKTRQQSDEFLLPYLRDRYEKDEKVKYGRKFIEDRFSSNFQAACDKLVELTTRDLYRNDFTIYLTTFPRGPYDYDTGSIWMSIDFMNPIANFMHEVLHFQFIHYWRNDKTSDVSKLSNDDFEMLKESLTVILDDSLVPLIERADKGYEIHQEFRNKLHDFWLKDKDFDALIEYGLKNLPN